MKLYDNDDFEALRKAQWEQEQQRPFDWQDRVVMIGGWIAFGICVGILVIGR